jgi:hypothetical protein
MKLKHDLGAALRRTAQSAPRPAARAKAQAAASERPGRDGKTNVTAYFPLNVKRQLRIMGGELDKTIQQMLAEALNDYFAKHGKPEIAPTEDE